MALLSAGEVAALQDDELEGALVDMERSRRLAEAAIVDVLNEPIGVGGTSSMGTHRCVDGRRR